MTVIKPYLNESFYNQQIECTSSSFVIITRDFIAIIFRVYVPFGLMLLANVLLIKSLLDSKKKINHDRSMKREHSFAIALILMNVFFLLNLIPQSVLIILLNFLPNKQNDVFYSTRTAFVITYYVSILNNVMPFLLHLKFNKIFYKETCNSLLELKYFVICKPKRIEDSSNGSNTVHQSSTRNILQSSNNRA